MRYIFKNANETNGTIQQQPQLTIHQGLLSSQWPISINVSPRAAPTRRIGPPSAGSDSRAVENRFMVIYGPYLWKVQSTAISENSLLIPVTFKPNDINYNVFIGTNFLNYDMLICSFNFLTSFKKIWLINKRHAHTMHHTWTWTVDLVVFWGFFVGFFWGGVYISS